MKKLIALFSSLLILKGLKAQTAPPPVVKKETVKPGTVQPGVIVNPAKNVAQKDLSHKDLKVTHIKKAPVVQMKESPAQMKETPAAKPHKY